MSRRGNFQIFKIDLVLGESEHYGEPGFFKPTPETGNAPELMLHPRVKPQFPSPGSDGTGLLAMDTGSDANQTARLITCSNGCLLGDTFELYSSVICACSDCGHNPFFDCGTCAGGCPSESDVCGTYKWCDNPYACNSGCVYGEARVNDGNCDCEDGTVMSHSFLSGGEP